MLKKREEMVTLCGLKAKKDELSQETQDIEGRIAMLKTQLGINRRPAPQAGQGSPPKK
jgi:outer membrane murein-binding lipoprotein Lpp